MSSLFDERGVPGAQQVVELLEVYADVRLAPRGAVLARIRRQVMADAAARAAGGGAHLDAAMVRPAARRSWSSRHLPRRVAAIGMAAAMTFATSAAVLAAPPGSVFYDARVQLEQALLPSRADDRLAAHERLLAERLEEADQAADTGNIIALQAALAAYQAEIDAAVADVGDDQDLQAFLDGALGTHVTLLEKIAAKVPDKAAGPTHAAVEQAMQAGEKAASKLHDAGRPAGTGTADEHASPPTWNGGHGGGEDDRAGDGDHGRSRDRNGGDDGDGSDHRGGDHEHGRGHEDR